MDKLLALGKLLAQETLTPPQLKEQNSPLERLQVVGGTEGLNLADRPLSEIIGTIISGVLGLLGVIFLVLMVYAGVMWMTAAGEEKKIETATKTIKNSVIGLALVLAAYGITRLIVNILGQAI